MTEEQRDYFRKYRKANRMKIIKINQRYWLRKEQEELAAAGG